jgi:hypothetical protein
MISDIPLEVKEYFNNGSKKIIKVETKDGYNLIITFNDYVKKMYDMSEKLFGVFEILKNKEKFNEVFIDEGNLAWDIDKNIDSQIHWNNRIDICSDTIYIYGETI